MNTHRGGNVPGHLHPSDTMIASTHTSAKVLTRTYKDLMDNAVINRNRVSEHQAEWLELPAGVGNGAYDNEARGWMDCPDWEGARQRFTPLDGPGHKGVKP